MLALAFVMDSKLAAVPKLMAWLGLFVAGAAGVVLFITGLMRNTRAALAAGRRAASAARPEFSPVAPDRSQAHAAAELLRVPADARDRSWHSRFYGTMANAALLPADPAEFTGPDGMPYSGFRLHESGATRAQLSLAVVAEALIARGCGAALNPRADQTVDWVFSCGDLLSLRMFGRIMTAPAPEKTRVEGATEREVLAGSPSEALLPPQARTAIRTFMQGTLGIAKPAVFLISDAAMEPPESLVFNASGEQLADGWSTETALRYLGWFLPRHYRAISVPVDSPLAQHFQPL